MKKSKFTEDQIAFALKQALLDQRDGLRHDPWPAACVRAPALAQPLRTLRLVVPATGIAPELAADGAGRTRKRLGNLAQAVAGLAQAVDAISFVLVQAADGHEQLHLAVKWLRSGRLGHFTTSGVAIGS